MRAILLGTVMLATIAAAPAYPPTRRVELVETRAGGTKVADPYRWLEGDVRKEPAVAAWVESQNRATDAYLATLPQRAAIKARLTELFNYERIGLPQAEGGRLFYRRNTGLQNQSTLQVADANGATRTLLDPNTWSKDGATALAEWQASRDGAHVAYTVQDGGSDWRTIRVVEVATGRVLPDLLDWAKFTGLAWDGKGEGFFYSRHPEDPKGKDFVSAVYDHIVYYHRLGTPQAQDKLIFRTPDHKEYYNNALTTADGRWLVLFSSRGSDDRYAINVVDLAKSQAQWSPVTIVPGLDHDYKLAGARGERLYFVTNREAPRYRVLAFDMAHPGSIDEIVPQGAARIADARRVGNRLVVESLVDARSDLVSHALTGPRGSAPVALPGIGNVELGEETDGPLYMAYSSFAVPTSIYRLAGTTPALWRAPKVAFDPADYETKQIFFRSKDGTRVPMFVTRKRSATGALPTILYGYGGFNISLPPAFSPTTVAWLEMGGAYAQANIRGGGEYGTEWHSAGKLFAKQNVFDDFIAAGETLIAQGLTPRNGLAISGGSNGGLLVGAVVNQRPELFAAAFPAVGVMDMTRFHLFTEGRTWTDDYGDPENPAALRYQLTYSPYHNVRGGQRYPAILVTTADTDDRVVPGHSFKYTAALQAAAIGDKPHLIRIETRAGHGSGKPVSKTIEETADKWAFAAHWTGLRR